MFKEVDEAVFSHKMFEGKSNVIVALSGGADSMCLLHYLVSNSERFGIAVKAAHVNHCLRGEESERDYRFVAEQCEKLNVPLFLKIVNIAELAKARKIGLEQCGREERYSFFAELATSEDTVIATAHTASDNAETVLFNITRGCGMEGLTGIPPIRGNIVRPLINASRTKIEEYCKEHGVPFVTDSSNLTDEYSRNKIRLSVLPTLAKINPSVEESINRLSSVISKNLAFIDSVVLSEYSRCVTNEGMSIQTLKKCDKNLLPSVIKYAVNKELNIIPEKKHIDLIEKIVQDGHGAVEPHKFNTVKVCGGNLIFVNNSNNAVTVESFEGIIPTLNNSYKYNNKTYTLSTDFSKNESDKDKINKKLLNQRISYDIISCDILLRCRKSGDIFKPIGRGCTKTVKKLFNELKIPQSERDTRLLLAKGNNVYWIEGIGPSQDALPKNEDEPFFVMEVSEENF